MSDETIIIADINKNSKEIIRVSKRNYKGHELVDIRVFYPDKDGDFLPTAKGISFKLSLLPQLTEILSLIEE